MKIKYLLYSLSLGFASMACSESANSTFSPANLGLNLEQRDLSVRPQDDFNLYANGAWLKKTAIPADKGSWGAFYELREQTLAQLHRLIDELSQQKYDNASNPAKIALIYNAFMEQQDGSPHIDPLQIKSLAQIFSRIDQLSSNQQIPQLIAYLQSLGITTPYAINIHQDARNSQVMVADLVQSGLGLPDRDYYLETKDANLAKSLVNYQQYIKQMLQLSGSESDVSTTAAKNIVALEKNLAQVQWSKVANRDPLKTYNKYLFKDLPKLAPTFPWGDYLVTTGLKSRVSYLIISQPSYIQGFNQVLNNTSLAIWQEYFKWHTLNHFAPYLSGDYVAANFNFYGRQLRGIPQNTPRWQRGLDLLEQTMGDALGRLYVAKYFPAQSKQQMEELVANLLKAYRISINNLDWMSSPTKIKALAKLNGLNLKIAYPSKWRDYTKLQIKAHDLVGNLIAAEQFSYKYELDKLAQPVDRSEWQMTPQTVNAYYNPELNEIVFPAGILQAPFFNPKADLAVNYGGIGAVIGHEISHGFDDEGSLYNAQGNLEDWFTPADHKKFKQKTLALVSQYSAYTPLKAYSVNGELTLGENIADNAGLAIAYKAYLLGLNGSTPAVIAGTTGPQRLYLSWANVWREKIRDAQLIVRLKSDPHSPDSIRCNGTLRNQDGFYAAYQVESGDKMYLAPEQRVKIW